MNESDTGADQSQSLTSRLIGLIFSALPAIGGAVGFVGFVAVIGGAIQWVRFDAAQLPASQAVAAMSRSELVALGAQAIIAFTLLGVLAVLIVYLADPQGIGNMATVRALAVVTVLEFTAVLIMVRTSFWGVVGSVLLFCVLIWFIARTVRASRLWLGATRLRLAQSRWQQAADAVRVQRALAATKAASGASPAEAEQMLRRRIVAERRLEEAERQWSNLVDELGPVADMAIME